jgi:hypothetical protein
MARRRTKKQKIKARLIKQRKQTEKRGKREEKGKKRRKGKKEVVRSEKELIVKDLWKTVWVAIGLLGLLALLYWRLR